MEAVNRQSKSNNGANQQIKNRTPYGYLDTLTWQGSQLHLEYYNSLPTHMRKRNKIADEAPLRSLAELKTPSTEDRRTSNFTHCVGSESRWVDGVITSIS